MKVEIQEVRELPDGDGLLVLGTVDGEPAEARVWKSHLYGDHAAVNKQRAADATRESKAARAAADEATDVTEIEIPALAKSEMLTSDRARKRYLAQQLVAAAAIAPEADAGKLTGKVTV